MSKTREEKLKEALENYPDLFMYAKGCYGKKKCRTISELRVMSLVKFKVKNEVPSDSDIAMNLIRAYSDSCDSSSVNLKEILYRIWLKASEECPSLADYIVDNMVSALAMTRIENLEFPNPYKKISEALEEYRSSFSEPRICTVRRSDSAWFGR